MTYLIYTAAALAIGALLFAERTNAERLRWFAKSCASLMFVALALSLGATETSYGRMILVGLVFCMAGDIFLLKKSETAFLAGMAAFGLGHLFYAIAFGGIFAGVSPGVIAASVATIAGVAFTFRWLSPHLGDFRIPVVFYTLIITAMMIMSFATTTFNSGQATSPYWLAVIGAVGFAISDISVARDQFVERSFFNRLWGLPLYFGAQLVLAASVSI